MKGLWGRLAPVAALTPMAFLPFSADAQTPQVGAPGAPTTPQVGAVTGEQVANRDEIVVTARRREEKVDEVPLSISVITNEQLADLGAINTIEDLILALPGVNFSNNGGTDSEITIRGAGAGTTTSNDTDSAVAIMLNGASITGGNLGGKLFNRGDLFDLGQVEVVRGAQGALYGVNAIGGVINVNSARPKPDFGWSLGSSFSNDTERAEYQAILNVPVTSRLAVRMGAHTTDQEGGFFYNAYDGRFGDRTYEHGGRVSALWEPTDSLKILTYVDASRESSPASGIKVSIARNDPTLTAALATDPDGPYAYNRNSRDRSGQETITVNNRIDWKTPLGQLTSQSNYRHRETGIDGDGDGTAPGYSIPPSSATFCATRLCTLYYHDETELISQELRLQSDRGGAFDWLFGANWQSKSNDYYQLNDGRTTSASILTPSRRQNMSKVSNNDEIQSGVFGAASWRATSHITLDAAARWSRSEKEGQTYTVQREAVVGQPCPYTTPQAVNPSSSCATNQRAFDATFTNVSPSASLTYKVNPNLSYYGSVGIGYRPGGFNPNAAEDPSIPATYDGERTTAYEMGAKIRRGRQFFTAAVHYNVYDDQLVIAIDPAADENDTAAYYRFNAGASATYGVDMEASGIVPIPRRWGTLNYTAAINFLDGTFNEGPFEGRTVEGPATVTQAISAIYKHPLPDNWRLVSSLQYRGEQGGYAKSAQVNNLVTNDDLALLRGKIGIENARWRLELTADNLTDESYVTRKTPRSSTYGPGRTVFLRASYALGSEARRR